MTLGVEVVVYGVPMSQGSKRHVGGGRLIESNADRLKPWRANVTSTFVDTVGPDWHPFTRSTPVEIVLSFYFARPLGHFRTGRNAHLLRDAAPSWPTGKPDLDKLERAVFDGLTDAGAWADDSQVVSVIASKHYVNSYRPRPCVVARVELVGSTP